MKDKTKKEPKRNTGKSDDEGYNTSTHLHYKKNDATEMLYDDLTDDDGESFKHAHEKQIKSHNLKEDLFPKLKFYIDCGLNVCLYGVGSKRDLLNSFLTEVLVMQGIGCFAVNGYHSASNIKSVLNSCFNWFQSIGRIPPVSKRPTMLKDLFETVKRGFLET